MRCFLRRSVFTILHTSHVVSYFDQSFPILHTSHVVYYFGQCLQYCTLHTLFLTSVSVYNTAHFTRCLLLRSVFTILRTSHVVSYFGQCLQYCTLHTLFLTSTSVYNTAHFTRCFLLLPVFTILHTSHVVSYFDQCLQYCTLHTLFLNSISIYNTAHFTSCFLLRSVFELICERHTEDAPRNWKPCPVASLCVKSTAYLKEKLKMSLNCRDYIVDSVYKPGLLGTAHVCPRSAHKVASYFVCCALALYIYTNLDLGLSAYFFVLKMYEVRQLFISSTHVLVHKEYVVRM